MTRSNYIVGILLAAGSSRRFGSDKLLHPLPNGIPIAVAAVRRLHLTCDRTLAVVWPGSDRLAELLAAEGVEVVASTESLYGMGHSLAAGIRASSDASAWIVALADMPFICLASYQCVADALRNGASIAAPAHDGARGHPVGFAGHWYERLSVLDGDEGARSILATNSKDIVLLPVHDPGILRDVDTRTDLAYWITQLKA